MFLRICHIILSLWIIVLFNTVKADTLEKLNIVSESVCLKTPLKKSQDMIRYILNDMTKTYTQVGGGGITGIKLIATNTFVVLVAQEERIDSISYELSFSDGCNIKVLKRELGAVTPWQK